MNQNISKLYNNKSMNILINNQQKILTYIDTDKLINQQKMIFNNSSFSTAIGNNPLVTPKLNPLVTPKLNPLVIPKLNPLVTPKLNPLVIPKLNPLVTPKLNPLVTPKLNPLVTPKFDVLSPLITDGYLKNLQFWENYKKTADFYKNLQINTNITRLTRMANKLSDKLFIMQTTKQKNDFNSTFIEFQHEVSKNINYSDFNYLVNTFNKANKKNIQQIDEILAKDLFKDNENRIDVNNTFDVNSIDKVATTQFTNNYCPEQIKEHNIVDIVPNIMNVVIKILFLIVLYTKFSQTESGQIGAIVLFFFQELNLFEIICDFADYHLDSKSYINIRERLNPDIYYALKKAKKIDNAQVVVKDTYLYSRNRRDSETICYIKKGELVSIKQTGKIWSLVEFEEENTIFSGWIQISTLK